MHYNKRYNREVDKIIRSDGKVEVWALMTLQELKLIKVSTPPDIKVLLPKKWTILNSYYPSNPKFHTRREAGHG